MKDKEYYKERKVQAYLPPGLQKQLQEYLDREFTIRCSMPSKSAVVKQALRKFLEAEKAPKKGESLSL